MISITKIGWDQSQNIWQWLFSNLKLAVIDRRTIDSNSFYISTIFCMVLINLTSNISKFKALYTAQLQAFRTKQILYRWSGMILLQLRDFYFLPHCPRGEADFREYLGEQVNWSRNFSVILGNGASFLGFSEKCTLRQNFTYIYSKICSVFVTEVGGG